MTLAIPQRTPSSLVFPRCRMTFSTQMFMLIWGPSAPNAGGGGKTLVCSGRVKTPSMTQPETGLATHLLARRGKRKAKTSILIPYKSVLRFIPAWAVYPHPPSDHYVLSPDNEPTLTSSCRGGVPLRDGRGSSWGQSVADPFAKVTPCLRGYWPRRTSSPS